MVRDVMYLVVFLIPEKAWGTEKGLMHLLSLQVESANKIEDLSIFLSEI